MSEINIPNINISTNPDFIPRSQVPMGPGSKIPQAVLDVITKKKQTPLPATPGPISADVNLNKWIPQPVAKAINYQNYLIPKALGIGLVLYLIFGRKSD